MSDTTDLRIGIDLGGSKIQGVVLDDRGVVLASQRALVPRNEYRRTVTAVVDLVHSLEREAGCRARVAVGCPGSISPVSGLHRNSNATWLIGEDLLGDLSRKLGRSIVMENDANCFALSEAQSDEVAGARVMVGVVLGTGVGSGLVIDGRIVRGRNAIGSELGHCSLPWPSGEEHPGPPCYCGRRGCIETFLAGGALTREYLTRGGVRRDARDIGRLASEGDEAAVECLSRYCGRLARSLAMVVNVLDPDVIVLGGGVARIPRIFDEVPGLLASWIFSDSLETRILPAVYGGASGARGAALLLPSA